MVYKLRLVSASSLGRSGILERGTFLKSSFWQLHTHASFSGLRLGFFRIMSHDTFSFRISVLVPSSMYDCITVVGFSNGCQSERAMNSRTSLCFGVLGWEVMPNKGDDAEIGRSRDLSTFDS
jgi:hypothetical protein